MSQVTEFRGKFNFLSNFHPSPIVVQGVIQAPTVEHAYQAFKCVRLEDAMIILLCPSAGATKRVIKQMTIRDDWHEVKLDVMAHLLSLKFATGSALADKLLATGDAELIEGNYWGDTFWGVCRGIGQNHLGRLLMERRQLLRT